MAFFRVSSAVAVLGRIGVAGLVVPAVLLEMLGCLLADFLHDLPNVVGRGLPTDQKVLSLTVVFSPSMSFVTSASPENLKAARALRPSLIALNWAAASGDFMTALAW